MDTLHCFIMTTLDCFNFQFSVNIHADAIYFFRKLILNFLVYMIKKNYAIENPKIQNPKNF